MAQKAGLVLGIAALWLVIQAILALSGFYLNTFTVPPRFILAVLPPLLFILWLFISKKGKTFIDKLPLGKLLLVNTVRVPVEITLFWLFLSGQIPEIMTFEGRNFDILVGFTAPFIYYFGFVKNKLSKRFLLIWNMVSLGILLNIVGTAILAAPTPFQQIAFEQPNMGVFYFPFIWLPCFIVPYCLFSHLAAIRQLTR